MLKEDLFWDVDAIELKDIPTVQELFDAADKTILAELFIDKYIECLPADKKVHKKKRKHALRKIKKMLAEMLEIKAHPSKKWIIFPSYLTNYSHDRDNLFRFEVQTNLIETSELAKAERVNSVSHDDVWGNMPKSCSLIDITWAKTLGMRVWLKGCKTAKERYLVLVDILWEMTEFGYSQKEWTKNIGKFTKKLEKAAKQPQKSYPANIFFRQLGYANYGLPTKELNLDDENEGRIRSHLDEINTYEAYLLCQEIAELSRMLKKGYHTNSEKQLQRATTNFNEPNKSKSSN